MTIKKALKTPFLTILFAFCLSLALTACQGSKEEAPVKKDAASLRGGENRPTLPPENYTGLTAKAYQAAREIPEVLDSLYCYCDCEKHFDHKSLLTCYVDEHAVNCDICQEEALMAYDLHKQGKDIKTIREEVDKTFSNPKNMHSH